MTVEQIKERINQINLWLEELADLELMNELDELCDMLDRTCMSK